MLSKLRKIILPIELITKNIPINSNILDIGCGRNQIYKKINMDQMQSYTGLDLMIKDETISKKIKVFNSSWEKFLEEIVNYDVILIIDILHHIKKLDQKILIETTLKNMKNGSTLIYKDISNKNFFFSLMNRLHDLIYNFTIINYYDSDKIISYLRDESYRYNYFKKRIFWYDHEFLIIKKI